MALKELFGRGWDSIGSNGVKRAAIARELTFRKPLKVFLFVIFAFRDQRLGLAQSAFFQA